MTDSIDTSKYCLFIQTHQASEIRTLIEALKDMLIHTNIEVTKDGLKIQQIGRERVSLIHLKLNSDSTNTVNVAIKRLCNKYIMQARDISFFFFFGKKDLKLNLFFEKLIFFKPEIN